MLNDQTHYQLSQTTPQAKTWRRVCMFQATKDK